MGTVQQRFKTMTNLQSYLYSRMRDVQELTLAEMEAHLDELIDEYVYQEEAGLIYERTNVLQKMWEQTEPYVKGGDVRGNIVADNHTFTQYQNRSKWQNESKYYKHIFVDDFVNIINNGVSFNHSVFGENIPARPFWDEFIKWSQLNYAKIFAKYSKQLGLPIRRTRTAQVNKAGTIVNK